MTFRIVIAAGGTGGHFYPGLAVLEALERRGAVDAVFVGTARGIEARVVPTLRYSLTQLDITPLNGVRGLALARSLWKLPGALWAGGQLLRRLRPDVVLSVGGYAAGPVSAAAVALRIPLAIVEPNALPGLTHRIVGRWATHAFVAYPEAERAFPSRAARLVGNPVRRAFVERAQSVSRARRETAHVLVVGGSQGARALNRAVPGAVATARAARAKLTITHQTGTHDYEDVIRAYAGLGIDTADPTLGVTVTTFIEDVASAMAAADLIVCRAGAGTVSEVCVIGRAALYVPLPTAADDHQRKNAESMSAQGAAAWMPQSGLTPDALGERIAELLRDTEALRGMEQRARALGRPDAADDIASMLLGNREGA